jgi:hypothetical protein
LVWSFESGFSGFRGFLSVGRWLSFESGFTGFRGFLRVGRWYGVLNQDLQDF